MRATQLIMYSTATGDAAFLMREPLIEPEALEDGAHWQSIRRSDGYGKFA